MSQALPVGAHEGFSEDTYHKRELGVASKSSLDLLHRSPAHYKAWVDGELEEEERPAFKIGKAFHCAVLEPLRFATQYVAEPVFGDMRFKAAKEQRAEWREVNRGMAWIPANEYLTIEKMAAKVMSHPLASRLLTDGKPELTLRWTDERTKVDCKARVDFLGRNGRTLVDLKSTANADHDEFRRSCASYGYHRQAAFYREGVRALGGETDHFIFIACEKTAPFNVAVYSLSDASVGKGMESIRDDLELMAACLKSGDWPGYPVRIQEIDLPPWAA